MRLVPARSAPAYEHQLHRNPTMLGSHVAAGAASGLVSSDTIFVRLRLLEVAAQLGVDLVVAEAALVDAFSGARRDA